MALYLIQADGLHPGALERARFIRDGFSRWAFIFGPLWLLVHRLWVPLLVWIAAEAFALIVLAPHLPEGALFLLDVLAHFYIGFEGPRLRLRDRAALTDAVEAGSLREAETIFYQRHAEVGARV